MLFHETKLSGAFVIDQEPHADERGFFARSWCQNEFKTHGLQTQIRQCNTSFNLTKGTIRGLHFQIFPYMEAKLIRCTRGLIFDVMVDIRPDSSTFLQWVGYELSDENHRSLFVPEGFAHGYQTLVDNTEVFYQVSEFYHPQSSCELRWDDPAIGITWPIKPRSMSKKDAEAPLSSELIFEFKDPK